MKKSILISVVVLAALTRIIPHPWNFTGVGALALFSGSFLNKNWQAVALTWASMLMGDLFFGLHSTMIYTYGSLALITFLGRWNHNLAESKPEGSTSNLKSILTQSFSWVTTSLVGSTLFFLITNFGVWLQEGLYSKTFAGLMECYFMGLPFFQNQILGDMVYLGAMLGVYQMAIKFVSTGLVKES